MSTTTEQVQHTPEPWPAPEPGHNTGCWRIGEGLPRIAVAKLESDARRIVAAVNACAGMPIEALEGGVVSELLDVLRSARHTIGDHYAPADCYSTGPVTGNFVIDHLACPACSFIARYDVVMRKAEGRDHG